MVKDLKKKKNDGKNVPFGQTNHEDFNKKNCTDFIRHQIKFYLEFSRWALLTWGPNFLFKDLQLTAIMLRFVSTSTTLFLSHQYLISPSHSTAHGTFRVGLDSASEEEEGSPFLDLFGFVFWGGGREGAVFGTGVSPLNISIERFCVTMASRQQIMNF